MIDAICADIFVVSAIYIVKGESHRNNLYVGIGNMVKGTKLTYSKTGWMVQELSVEFLKQVNIHKRSRVFMNEEKKRNIVLKESKILISYFSLIPTRDLYTLDL